MVKGRQLYAVKQILARKEVKGKVLYLVRWKGYGSADDTWEPKEHLHSVSDLLQEFEAHSKPSVTGGSTPKSRRGRRHQGSAEGEKPSVSDIPEIKNIQGCLEVDEIEHLSKIMKRPSQREFVCEVSYKPRVSGVQVNNSIERLVDLRYRCPQLLIDLLLGSLLGPHN